VTSGTEPTKNLSEVDPFYLNRVYKYTVSVAIISLLLCTFIGAGKWWCSWKCKRTGW